MKHSRHPNAAAATTAAAADIDADEDWLSLESKMTSILSKQKSQSDTELTLAKRSTALRTVDLASHSNRLQTDSSIIQSHLNRAIAREKQALDAESNELGNQLSTISQLAQLKENLHQQNSLLGSKISNATSKINQYQDLANTNIQDISLIEAQHIKNIPKIKHELTLHATMTNIKWDYTSLDVLKGEVSLVNRGVLRKFEIDKMDNDGLSEFEIAERLWDIIEG
jgi:hypothetical protein